MTQHTDPLTGGADTGETIDREDNLGDADTLADLPADSDRPDGTVTHGPTPPDSSAVDAPTLPDSGAPATTDGVRGVDPPMSGSQPGGETSDRATGVTTLRG